MSNNSDAFWSKDRSRRIVKRIIVEGELVLETPVHFGSGESSDEADMPLLVDEYDGSPLLTGTSLAGSLRAYLRSRQAGYAHPYPISKTENKDRHQKELKEEQERLAVKLFGSFRMDDEGRQSPLIVEDSLGKGGSYGIEIRNGVRLETRTRTAKEGALYDMQLWQAGTIFPMRLELLISDQHPDEEQNKGWAEEKKLCQALAMALEGLQNGDITMGTRKRRGFGRIKVSSWTVKQFDLRKPTQLIDWLENGATPIQTQSNVRSGNDIFSLLEVDAQTDQRQWFALNAQFSLEGSLLIRSNGREGDKGPDMVHLTNHAKQPILSGTSVAGALRQQARRILSVVRPNDPPFLDDLFGVDAKASRLTVEETKIEEPQFDLVQNRVAIDRFTGGALDSALFNEQPVFGTSETRLHINLRVINPTDGDIGLLLLLLKDLWTGLLPLGGEISVGRGRLKGESAEMVLQQNGKKESFSIKSNGEALDIKPSAERLQPLVDALWEEAKNE